MTLYQALRAYREQDFSSFHTPGHKGGGKIPPDLLSLDVTELPETDSLFEAEGILKKAEEHAAAVFQTAATFFSAGGCTLCIQAMLRLAAPQGGKILCGRVIHRSAVQAMALLGLTPVWISPRRDAGPGFPGRIAPEDVRVALEKHSDIAAVYLTSPDYYGVIADIPAIRSACGDVPLLVDNAHGAHLGLLQPVLHPIRLGAAMAASSAHKTLPVLTGGAYLDIADPAFVPGAKEAMALFGSTSPSYPILVSLDECARWMEQEGGRAFQGLAAQVGEIREKARALGFDSPSGRCDPVRLTLRPLLKGLTGERFFEELRERKIQPEYHDGASVVLLPTPMNRQKDLERLSRALEEIAAAYPGREDSPPPEALPPLPPARCTPRQAILAPSRLVALEDSLGRVAAEAACPCPPGVPIVMPGEEITKDCMNFLRKYGIVSLKVVK